MKKITEDRDYSLPPTIDGPAILDVIEAALTR